MLPTITVIGNLKKIETRFTQSGKQVTSFQIECADKNAKGEWNNLYLKGSVWDNQAEFVNQYFQEGSVAIVTGKLFTDVYKKQDGSNAYEVKLLFPSVGFAPKDKSDSQGSQQNQNHQQPNQQPNQQPQQDHTAYREPQRQMPDASSLPEIDMDESIPF